jgi:hypothetical protein
MLQLAMKAVNRWRRIYHLQRHGKQILQRPDASTQVAYIENPRITTIVQLFNKRQNIEAIVAGLLVPTIDEIIVVDDGSSDGALEILPRLLTEKNHFIIRSNDVFEIRSYSRALDFARGEIRSEEHTSELQSPDGAWVTEA